MPDDDITGLITHGVPSAATAVANLVLAVAEAVRARLQAELLGDEPPDALAVHRQPRGARRRDDVQPVLLEREQLVRRDRLELGHDEQLRAGTRALGLEHRPQRRGVGHVDDGVALRDLHRGRAGVAVDREHLAAEPQRLDRDLAAELAAAEQHDAHGGVGQRRSGGEAHDRAAYGRACVRARTTCLRVSRRHSRPDARYFVSFTVRLTVRVLPAASTIFSVIVAVTRLPFLTAALIFLKAALTAFLLPFGLSFSVRL